MNWAPQSSCLNILEAIFVHLDTEKNQKQTTAREERCLLRNSEYLFLKTIQKQRSSLTETNKGRHIEHGLSMFLELHKLCFDYALFPCTFAHVSAKYEEMIGVVAQRFAQQCVFVLVLISNTLQSGVSKTDRGCLFIVSTQSIFSSQIHEILLA